MGDAGLTDEEGCLASDLVATLHPRLKDALNHPTRRDVLRALRGKRQVRSVGEIAAGLPPLKRAEVGYHATVLDDLECIEERGTRPGLVGRERVFGSCLVDDPQAQLVLEATERADDEHRRRLARRESPGTMAMFRVPGPAIAIRLLNRRRTLEQN